MGVRLLHGNCLKILPTFETRSIDACVTDPPYGLTFMGKNWDHGVPGRLFWRRIYRVLKPGAHLVAFGSPRTYHRLACAIEDAGFEIRDSLMWLYGTGFPKSHDVSKGIDKAAGAERPIVGTTKSGGFARIMKTNAEAGFRPDNYYEDGNTFRSTEPITKDARQWEGWGTALKPAFEPIVLARKPLSEGTVAANVLRWGTGALNIDGCRVGTEARPVMVRTETVVAASSMAGTSTGATSNGEVTTQGRWPANVVHDGSDEVVGAFPETDSGGPSRRASGHYIARTQERGVANLPDGAHQIKAYQDARTAARFFYTAKADKQDRIGSKHPTVKPIKLKRWVIRLITPPNSIVLDPFAGSGTTARACELEGFDCILIEKEAEYIADIKRRFPVKEKGMRASKKNGFFHYMKD